MSRSQIRFSQFDKLSLVVPLIACKGRKMQETLNTSITFLAARPWIYPAAKLAPALRYVRSSWAVAGWSRRKAFHRQNFFWHKTTAPLCQKRAEWWKNSHFQAQKKPTSLPTILNIGISSLQTPDRRRWILQIHEKCSFEPWIFIEKCSFLSWFYIEKCIFAA